MNSYYWKDGWMVRNTDGAVMAKVVVLDGAEGQAILSFYDAYHGPIKQARRFISRAAAESWGMASVDRIFHMYEG